MTEHWYNRECNRYRGDYDSADDLDTLRRNKIEREVNAYQRWLDTRSKVSECEVNKEGSDGK